MDGRPKRRVFEWSHEARLLAADCRKQTAKTGERQGAERAILVAKLESISGHPRDACLRFLRRLGVAGKRSYREWTKPEQQRLVELIEEVPVEEVARILRRPAASVRSMLHRLRLGGRQSREWFTLSLLAGALHVGRDQVRRWIQRGWLQTRIVQSQGVKIQIIDPDDFSEFIKEHGPNVIGRRLSHEGLEFVRNYVFPPKHAPLLAVRGSYKKAAASAPETGEVDSQGGIGAEDDDAFDQSA